MPFEMCFSPFYSTPIFVFMWWPLLTIVVALDIAESELFDVSEHACACSKEAQAPSTYVVSLGTTGATAFWVWVASPVGLLAFWLTVILQLSFCASECVWGAVLESSDSGT